MPVYLCKSGTGHEEPWRHGLQVYSSPCPNPTSPSETARDLILGNWTVSLPSNSSDEPSNVASLTAPPAAGGDSGASAVSSERGDSRVNHPIRKLKHGEVVLVDDVCIAYDRYWLRLRWPGHRGGFAGYVGMGLVADIQAGLKALKETERKENPGGDDPSSEDRGMAEDIDMDDPAREETSSMPSEPLEMSLDTYTCARTGLAFQSAQALVLLGSYDDGIVPSVTLPSLPTDNVFCRICREGLHDDADEVQPLPTDAGDADQPQDPGMDSFNESEAAGDADVAPSESSLGPDVSKGPVQPHPEYREVTDADQNPMLAPCECSGSMAFVHLLCVEQWRCRSRHPEAMRGLNCETCGTKYALPPPEGPMHEPQQDHDDLGGDWLDAMPLHVMQALRQPHIWWQLGAAIVRRRWLRPLAPIFMSPIVALYCRARRLLKKRGVARRRWACSLCRRRARWKCVRCLRSYYCSRQCQNVSWHIIHKHVCYKPARFWWSVVVYSMLTLLLFPGLLRDPLMYDIGLTTIPLSFVIMGVLFGSLATVLKKAAGFDVRGRGLEITVVVATLWLFATSWALVRGFFGRPSSCYGWLSSYSVTREEIAYVPQLRLLQWALLKPAEGLYRRIDQTVLESNKWAQYVFCSDDESTGCFEYISQANADFLLAEEDGQNCASDVLTITSIYTAAGISYAVSALWKQHERQRRRGRRHAHND